MATQETRKFYDACPKHGLWHDLSQECFICMCERTQEEWRLITQCIQEPAFTYRELIQK